MVDDERSQIPDVLRELVAPLLSAIASGRIVDHQRPATLLQELQRDSARAAEAVMARPEAMDTMLAFIGEIDFAEVRRGLDEATRAAKRGAAADQRYSLLLNLVRGADAACPHIAVVAFARILQPEFYRRFCEPVDLLLTAEASKGEVRARALMRAAREIGEWLYEPYLRLLWELSEFGRGKRAKWPPFGQLVNQCVERFAELPRLVEPQAALLRNAGAHATWVYVAAEKSIIMWDEGKTPTRVTLATLQDTVMAMWQVAGPTLWHVASLHVVRDLVIGKGLMDLFEQVAKVLLSRQPADRTAALELLEEWRKQLTAPLEQFFGKCL